MVDIANVTLFYLIIGLGALVLGLFVWIVLLSQKIKKFLHGKNATSLEDTIHHLITEYKKTHEQQKELEKEHAILQQKLYHSIRGVGFKRFNPFKDSGGNQSFVLALVNEKGNGSIISTLFARERMSVFGKEIVNFTCEQNLSNEEQSALDEARSRLILS